MVVVGLTGFKEFPENVDSMFTQLVNGGCWLKATRSQRGRKTTGDDDRRLDTTDDSNNNERNQAEIYTGEWYLQVLRLCLSPGSAVAISLGQLSQAEPCLIGAGGLHPVHEPHHCLVLRPQSNFQAAFPVCTAITTTARISCFFRRWVSPFAFSHL